MTSKYNPRWVGRLLRGLQIEKTDRVGFVYFIQAEQVNLIKIGWTTNNPMVRMYNMQSDCPVKLSMLGVEVGLEGMEAHFHQLFAEFRVHHEWFRPEQWLLNHIDLHAIPWIDIVCIVEQERKKELVGVKPQPAFQLSPRIFPGAKFGNLTVIKRLPKEERSYGMIYRVLCQCDCGRQSSPLAFHLTGGNTSTCGCGRKPHLREPSSPSRKPSRSFLHVLPQMIHEQRMKKASTKEF